MTDNTYITHRSDVEPSQGVPHTHNTVFNPSQGVTHTYDRLCLQPFTGGHIQHSAFTPSPGVPHTPLCLHRGSDTYTTLPSPLHRGSDTHTAFTGGPTHTPLCLHPFTGGHIHTQHSGFTWGTIHTHTALCLHPLTGGSHTAPLYPQPFTRGPPTHSTLPL